MTLCALVITMDGKLIRDRYNRFCKKMAINYDGHFYLEYRFIFRHQQKHLLVEFRATQQQISMRHRLE
jgi:hypothetical protein